MHRILAPIHELWCPPRGQNPALDALRSIAIVVVIAFHSREYVKSEVGPNLFTRFPIVQSGWMGVDLFFALSGYLIGRQLWREFSRTGTIDFGQFMIRRGFRIWPLYYATLVCILLILKPGAYGFANWWPDLVFLSNYFDGIVRGGWSLCVEEHFYLFAPLLLIIGGRWLRGVAAFRPLLLFLLLLLPVVRAIIWWGLTADGTIPSMEVQGWRLYAPTHVRADGLLIGVLIANLEFTGALKQGTGWLSSIWVVPIGFGLCGLCYLVHARLFNYTGLALAFGSLICFCLPRATTLPRFVQSLVFYWLSRLSYGMYLNHMWLNFTSFDVLRTRVLDPQAYPILFSLLNFAFLVLTSALVAVATFCLIEYPFLQMRERILARRRSVTAAAVQDVAIVAVRGDIAGQ